MAWLIAGYVANYGIKIEHLYGVHSTTFYISQPVCYPRSPASSPIA